jgi:hypothetical protein
MGCGILAIEDLGSQDPPAGRGEPLPGKKMLVRAGADAHAVEGAVDEEEGDGEEDGREDVG